MEDDVRRVHENTRTYITWPCPLPPKRNVHSPSDSADINNFCCTMVLFVNAVFCCFGLFWFILSQPLLPACRQRRCDAVTNQRVVGPWSASDQVPFIHTSRDHHGAKSLSQSWSRGLKIICPIILSFKQRFHGTCHLYNGISLDRIINHQGAHHKLIYTV